MNFLPLNVKLLETKSLLVLLCFTILVIGIAMPALADEKTEEVKYVLLLNSYHQKMTWVKDIVKGVEDVIRPNENNISLHIENLDSKLFSSPEYFDIFRDYLRVKYRNTQFSLILSSDNNAYDFLRQNRDTLFPGVPVSFCGVNNFNKEQIANVEGFTGVAEIFSARETVELALQLHPDVRELFVINDYLKTGRAWAKDIDIDLQGVSRRVKVRHAENLVISELMDEISQLDSGSLILLGVYFSDRDGQYFTYERIGAMLSQVSKVPVYCLLEFNIGKGIVGGQVISGYYQGKTMAELGMKILAGADVTSIPVKLVGSNKVVFDHSQLVRFGIDESHLPQGNHIINRPYSFYETYKIQIWLMVGVIVALLITILTLVVNIMRRLRAERALREREGELKSLFENNPVSCWLEDFSAVKNYFDELRADGVSDLENHFSEYPNAVVKCSQLIKIKDVNQATLALHKAKSKEELFQGLDKTFTPESLIVFQKELVDMWNGKTETTYDAIVKTLDNELRYITVSYKIAPGHEESLDNILVTLFDITDRKSAEDALRASTREYQSTVEGLLAGVIVHAADTKVLICNKEATNILGLTKEQIVGKQSIDSAWKFVHEDSSPMNYEEYPASIVISTKTPLINYTVGISRPDKKNITWVLVNATPLLSSSGVLEKVIVNFINITEQKREAEEKKNLTVQLQHSQKMEAIGTLAGGIAHDFNNILSAILGYSELAKNIVPQNSTISNHLGKILQAGHRAKKLVQQILAFSHRDHTDRVPLQPASIVDEAMKMLRPTLPTTIEIIQNIEPTVGYIFANPTQMNQILMNLCTNAFHAMEERGGMLEITVKETQLNREDLALEPNINTGAFFHLSVGDSGPGIPAKVKGKIFDPYFTTKATGKGTGLGLSLVHGIVTSYGGFVSIDSDMNRGAIFHVFIPITHDNTPPLEEEVKLIPGGKERVLFVDDEAVLTELYKSLLEGLGYHVTISNRSSEALEVFKEQSDQFDIVVTDQTMPGLTGSEMAAKMMQIRPDIPIILYTGYSTTISEKMAKSMGIKGFAFKPLSKKDIAVLLRKVLDVS